KAALASNIPVPTFDSQSVFGGILQIAPEQSNGIDSHQSLNVFDNAVLMSTTVMHSVNNSALTSPQNSLVNHPSSTLPSLPSPSSSAGSVPPPSTLPLDTSNANDGNALQVRTLSTPIKNDASDNHYTSEMDYAAILSLAQDPATEQLIALSIIFGTDLTGVQPKSR